MKLGIGKRLGPKQMEPAVGEPVIGWSVPDGGAPTFDITIGLEEFPTDPYLNRRALRVSMTEEEMVELYERIGSSLAALADHRRQEKSSSKK